MNSFSRAIPAAFAVLALALTLGLASSLWTSSDAEAASQPAPIAAPSIVDADSCTTYTTGYFPFGGIYGYPYTMPFGYGYPQSFTYPCNTAQCIGYSTFYLYQAPLICPGPPASIELPATNSATCASATNYTVKVRDANGLSVLPTSVSFSVAPFGMITGTVDSDGGEATASLQTPTKTSGLLTITVTAGSVTQTGTVNVSCSAPGSVSFGGGGSAAVASQPQAPVYTPPTGGGGGGGGGYGGY